MKKIMSMVLVFGYTILQGIDDNIVEFMTKTAITAGTVVTIGAIVLHELYNSNEAIIQKIEGDLTKVDTCENLLPPDSWTDTREAYCACYIKNKFSLSLSDVNEATSQVVDEYVLKQKKVLEFARRSVEWRSHYFNDMKSLLVEIERLELLLEKASLNATLYYRDFFLEQQVKNLHSLLRNIDACKDLLPYASWNDSLEAYFEHYLQTRLSIKLVAIDAKVIEALQDYVLKNKLNLFIARKSALYLHRYYDEMKEVLFEIDEMELLLQQATLNITMYYSDFLLSHQLLNVYVKLPTHDLKWCKAALLPEKENRIVKWVRRILLSHKQYPLISFKEMVFHDLKVINEFINSRSFVLRYPSIHTKLIIYRDSLEAAYDILLNTTQLHDEKDDKHKADLLQIKQNENQISEKTSWAAEQIAEQAAWAMRQSARMQQDVVDAELRQARALEEANRIALERKKEAVARRK